MPRLVLDDEVTTLLDHDGLPRGHPTIDGTGVDGQSELVVALTGWVRRSALRTIAPRRTLPRFLALLGTFPEQLLVSQVAAGRVHSGAVTSVDSSHQIGEGGVGADQALALWVGQRGAGNGVLVHDPEQPPASAD